MSDAAKGAAWKERGCEVALADMNDRPSADHRLHRRERPVRADPVELRPDARLPLGQGHLHRPDDGDRGCEATDGRLSLDHWRAGDAAEPYLTLP